MEVYSSHNRDGEGRVRKKHYRIITSLCSVAIMFMKEPNANFGGHTIICIYTTIYMHACLLAQAGMVVAIVWMAIQCLPINCNTKNLMEDTVRYGTAFLR